MNASWICQQIPRDFGREKQVGRVVHRITVPSYGEKGWYITVASMNAFDHGIRRNATAADKARGTDGCCWSSEFLFYLKREEEWEREQEWRAADPVLADLDERKLPIIGHASLWDFYRHIGFDHKRRRYIKD